ncbi:MAG: hypothetical protein JSW65_01745 [Candidatus Bipolaricaulota bacterium]|nr:MAG: hypothetical protein JSW65_01745 [Candidatus Bipolaricaulota bacterium]
MEPRFLALDWDLRHPAVLVDSFYEAPSLAAFDAVFVDPAAISARWRHDIPAERDGRRRTYAGVDYGLGRTLSRIMIKRRRECSDLLLRGGGLVICRLRPRADGVEIVAEDGPQERVDRYSWLPTVSLVDRQHQLTFPTNGRFVARRGHDIRLEGTGSPFEEYLRAFAGQVEYTAVYEDLLSTPIDRFATVLARNRVGDVLALEIPFEDGAFVLVPPLQGVSPAREATVLAQVTSDVAGRGSFSPEPDWTPSVPFPGEEALRDELSSVGTRREKLDAKASEIEAKLAVLLGPKPMLYAKGRRVLLPAVGEALCALGFEVTIEFDHILARSDEGDAQVVATATESAAVDITSYRRLLRLVDAARTEDVGPEKGILVVSGSRELDPRHRPTQYTDAVVRGCRSQGFCLLTTFQLYKLVVSVAEGGDDASSQARRLLLDASGELRRADLT